MPKTVRTQNTFENLTEEWRNNTFLILGHRLRIFVYGMNIKKGVVKVANVKILEQKQLVIDEIKEKFNNAKSVVLFDPRGLKVSEVTELRRALRESGSDYKVYKNTLAKRALVDSGLDLDSYLEGPTAISFSTDELAPVKILSDFAKTHAALELKAGVVEGKVAGTEELSSYAAIPSREGLLTMLAGGLIGTVKDLSICLDLYSKEKEEN